MCEINTGIYQLQRDSSDDVHTFDDGNCIFYLRLKENRISCTARVPVAGSSAPRPIHASVMAMGDSEIKKTNDFEYTTEAGQVLVISPDFSEIEVITV